MNRTPTFAAIFCFAALLFFTRDRGAISRPSVARGPASRAGQQAPSATPTNLIDGSVDPQLIPDSVAYRLVFLAAATGTPPSAEGVKRQEAILANAGIRGQNLQNAATILGNFKAKYTAMLAQYNASWYVTHDSTTGLSAFLAQRDALVQSTRQQLTAALGQAVMGSFDKYVQQQKSMMKVAEQEARQ